MQGKHIIYVEQILVVQGVENLLYARLCRKMSSSFLKNNIITKADVEIFEFGMERILSIIVSCSLLLIVGLCCNAVPESVAFFLCFYFARKYAGGYHADNYIKCNTCYLLTFILALIGTKYIMDQFYLDIVMIIISIFVMVTVLLFAPINNPNNPILPGKEGRFFILAMLMNAGMIGVVFLVKPLSVGLSVFIISSLFMSAVYMHIEIIKRREWGMTKVMKSFGEKIAKLALRNAKGSTREVSILNAYQAKRPAILDKNDEK